MNDKISKIELIEFVKYFATRYSNQTWNAKTFTNELEDWQNSEMHFIKIKRMGLTIGTIDIKGVNVPTQREVAILVHKTFPEFNELHDSFELITG